MTNKRIEKFLYKLKWGHNYPVCGWFWCGYPLTDAEEQMENCPACSRKIINEQR